MSISVLVSDNIIKSNPMVCVCVCVSTGRQMCRDRHSAFTSGSNIFSGSFTWLYFSSVKLNSCRICHDLLYMLVQKMYSLLNV